MNGVVITLLLCTVLTLANAFTALPLRSQTFEHMANRRSNTDQTALTGCPGSDFTVSVTIGSSGQIQTFELTIDTGSSTLAVAGDNCCGTTSSYTTSLHTTATNTGEQVTSTYGDGSGWTGTIWTDTVNVGGVSVSGMKIAVQTSQNNFYNPSCSTSTVSRQGILGMAYENLAVQSNDGSSTDSFPNAVEVAASSNVLSGKNAQHQGSGGGLVFGLQLCATTGQLFLGPDSSNNGYGLATTAPVYVPITQQSWYVINLNSMLIGSTTLPNDFGTTIVDSGTTQLVVPRDIFNAVQTVLEANSVFVAQFGSGFLTGSQCQGSSMTIAQLNAALPTLTFNLDNNVQLTVPAINSYLQSSGAVYCPGIGFTSSSSDPTILGWSFMNNFIVIFDRTTTLNSMGSIGIAATTSCGSAAATITGNTTTTHSAAAAAVVGGGGGEAVLIFTIICAVLLAI